MRADSRQSLNPQDVNDLREMMAAITGDEKLVDEKFKQHYRMKAQIVDFFEKRNLHEVRGKGGDSVQKRVRYMLHGLAVASARSFSVEPSFTLPLLYAALVACPARFLSLSPRRCVPCSKHW